MFHVKHDPETDALDLPPDVDRATYYNVQEALANATRHFPGADVRFTIEGGRDTLTLTVHDGPPKVTSAGAGAGLGLIGMRERVDIVGDELDVGPDGNGGFRAHTLLPLLHRESRR